jgi:hypothetical protein
MTELTNIEYHVSNYETHSEVNLNRSYFSIASLLTKLEDLKKSIEHNIFTIAKIQDASIIFYNNLFDLYKTINYSDENCEKHILRNDLCEYIRFSINLLLSLDTTKVKYEKKLENVVENLMKTQAFDLNKVTVLNFESSYQNLLIKINKRIDCIKQKMNVEFKRIKNEQNDFFGILLERYDKPASDMSNNKLAIFEEIVEMKDINNNIDLKSKIAMRIDYFEKLAEEMSRFFTDEAKMIKESKSLNEEFKNYVNDEGAEKLNQKYQKDPFYKSNNVVDGEVIKTPLKETSKSKIPLSITTHSSKDKLKTTINTLKPDKKQNINDLENELRQTKKLLAEQEAQIEKYKKDIKNLENQVKRKTREKENVSKRLAEMAKENENIFQRYQFEKRKANPSRKIFDSYNQLVFLFEELVNKYFLYQENSSRLYYELSGADINYKKVVLYREMDKNINRKLLENALAGLKMIFSKDNLNLLTLEEYERLKEVKKMVKNIEDLLKELK